MQLNFSIDDDLHQRLLDLSKSRGTSLSELTRATLRALTPDVETLKIRKFVNEQQPDPNVELHGKGTITELYLENGKYWCGSIQLDPLDAIKLGDVFSLDNHEVVITTENGRQGTANITSFTGGKRGCCIQFSGVTRLS